MPDMARSSSRREAGVSSGGGAEAGALEGVGTDTVIRVNTYKQQNSTTEHTTTVKFSAK